MKKAQLISLTTTKAENYNLLVGRQNSNINVKLMQCDSLFNQFITDPEKVQVQKPFCSGVR